MTTTLTVNLTQAMVDQYKTYSDVYFQIYLFDTTQQAPLNTPVSIAGTDLETTLTWNPSTSTYQYDLVLNAANQTMVGAKVYFVLQAPADGTPFSISSQSDINWTAAVDNNFRFDSIEFALTNSATDAVNLTSVENFGFAMMLDVPGSGTASYSQSASDMFTSLGTIGTGGASTLATYTGGTLNGQTLGAISPATSVPQPSGDPGAGVFTASQWNGYVTALGTNATTWDVGIAGFYTGGKDVNDIYHNAAFYSYEVEYDSNTGYYWLSPTATSQVQGYIRFSAADLANSIYSTLGTVEIFESKTSTAPYEILDNGGPDMITGAANQWGAVITQFIVGFTAGYYGVEGVSANSAITTDIDLSDNWNWDPSYAFGQNLKSGDTPTFMDPYAKVFYTYSNSYGSGYTDALMSHYSVGGPQVTIGTIGGDVGTINVTLFGDSETPTNYVTPAIYTYIAPPTGSDYSTVGAAEGNSLTPRSVVLNFTNAGMQLADGIPVTLQIYGGLDSSNNEIWHKADLGSPTSLWTTWNFQLDSSGNYITDTDGNYQLVADPGATPVPGSMTFAFLPTLETGVAWYQIVVGADGDAAQKIFNLYTTSNGNYLFETDPGDLAVDGLATVAASAATPNTFTVNFLYGTTSTLDPSLLVQAENFTYYGATPTAPVAGTLTAGIFTAFDDQTALVSNSIAVTSGEVAFGWTGDNDAVSTPSWISGRTNKVNSLNVALLSFAGGSAIAPLAVSADVDGQWTSSVSQQLGNGTYTVTMQEFSASDTTHSNPLATSSSALTLNVNLSDLDLSHSATGIGLVDDVTDTSGNWISLQTLSSSLAPEATLILYRVNGSGQMIDSQGNVVSDLSDATMAYVGSVHSDSGATLFNGSQTVYLGLGQELRFALQTGADSITTLPSFAATTQGDGSLHVSVGGVELSATTHNTLDGGNNLASVQRIYDLPMVYLTQGQELTVDVAGSAANTNDLHFVRFDVNLTTGEISVGGVAYGDTPEFHAAVLANFDAGYSASLGGGTFSAAEDWTVSGSNGYYAPVLITQSGDIFVPGTGNSGGQEYIRIFGENTFGFEDLTAAQGSDFDYNDMVMRLVPHI